MTQSLIPHIMFFPRTPASISTQHGCQVLTHDQLANVFAIPHLLSLINSMLFKHYCQNKTVNFIQDFPEHSLVQDYWINLPEYQHPLLVQLLVIPISLDSLSLLPVGILLSQFQFPIQLLYSFLFVYSNLHHALQSPYHNPLLQNWAVVPIFLLVSWITNHYS